MEGLEVCGDSCCPVMHLRLSPPPSSRDSSEQLLQRVVEECMDNGVAIVTAKYLEDEVNLPPPRWVGH